MRIVRGVPKKVADALRMAAETLPPGREFESEIGYSMTIRHHSNGWSPAFATLVADRRGLMLRFFNVGIWSSLDSEKKVLLPWLAAVEKATGVPVVVQLP